MGKVRLSKPQSRAFYSTSKSVGVCAGYGSGKTKVALEKAFNLLFSFPGVPVAYGAPTYDLINSIWYPAIESHCVEQGIKYDINKSKNIINFPGLGNMICRSLSNPSKIVGWECGSAILDEFDVLPTAAAKDAWLKMKARCRYKYPKFKKRRDVERFGRNRHPNQMFAVSTPEGFKAFYEYFEEDPLAGSQLIRMTTHSNQANLPDDYIDELMSQYPPQLIRAYLLGIFVNLTQGAVYPNFKRPENENDKNHNLTNRVVTKHDKELHIGMDFNVSKMAATVSVIDNYPKEVEVISEFGIPYLKKVNQYVLSVVDEFYKLADTPTMIEAIKERYDPKRFVINIYPDASGKSRKSTDISKSDITLLENADFNVVVHERNPFVRDRILSVNGMIENGYGERRFKINPKKAPKTLKCMEQQVYDDNGIPDKKRDIDHLPDTVGYKINQLFGIAKPKAITRRI